MAITLLFTDGDLTPLGQPIARFTEVDVTLRFNEPGSAVVTIPALGDYISMAQPGNRLEVIRDGQVLIGGPIEYPGQFAWDPSNSDTAEPGVLTVASTDDSVWLASRLVYPDPAHASTAQTTDYYTLTGANAETAMRSLVNLNAGPGALTARQVPHLVLGSVASVGSNINVHARMSLLSDELRAAAVAGGGLGFTVVRAGSNLEFRVYGPSDLTDVVRFSRGLKNLRSLSYQAQAPTATVAIVGGDGDGTSRTFVERSDSTALATWGRIETFVNDTSDDTTDLNQSGDQALVDAGEQGQLAANAIDTPTQRFGTHYGLGDKVSVEIYPGLEVADVVRAVNVNATKAGEVVTPQIGTGSMTTDTQTVRQLRAAFRRLGVLERT